MGKRFFYFIISCFIVAVGTDASTFRLKNVPEQFAQIEGAIVAKDGQTITIMTVDNLMVRSLDTIEIIKETPGEDKKFIEEYGPKNALYQAYLGKDTPPAEITPAVVQGEQSIAKPGEKYTLRYSFKEGTSQYLINDVTITTNTKMGTMDVAATVVINSLFSLRISEILQNGNAILDVNPESIDGIIQIGQRKQKMPEQLIPKVSRKLSLHPTDGCTDMDEELPFGINNGTQGEDLSQIIQSMFIAIPPKAVSIGESWKKTNSIDVPGSQGKIDVTMESQLKDIVLRDEGKYAVITSKVTSSVKDISINPTSSREVTASPVGNLKINKMDLDQTMVSYFGMDEGFPSSVRATRTITIDVGQSAASTVPTYVKVVVESNSKISDRKK